MHRTFQVLATEIPVPSVVPRVHYEINNYLVFDLNISAIHAAIYILYYFALEPIAAVSYEANLVFNSSRFDSVVVSAPIGSDGLVGDGFLKVSWSYHSSCYPTRCFLDCTVLGTWPGRETSTGSVGQPPRR